MCFYQDYGWYAAVNDALDTLAWKESTCFECDSKICVGDVCRVIHQQEHESCQICEEPDSSDFAGSFNERTNEPTYPPPCEDGEHDYGEIFDATICLNCLKTLESIKDFETREGCPEGESQPGYGELGEVFLQHESKWDYAEACVDKFPELAEHAWIKTILERDE